MADSGPGSAEHPLSFGPLWRRTLAVIRRHGDLLWPLAGAMFFLPQLLIAMVGPERVAGAGAGFDFAASLPELAALLFALLVTVAGQLVVAFIAVRDGTAGLTFGAVIANAGRLIGPAFAMLLLQGLATFAGLLLLVVPGLLLFVRLAVALPLLATGSRDPLLALTTSWKLTDGYTLRILISMATLLGAIILFYAGMLSLGILLGSPEPLTASAGRWSFGRWLLELLGAGAVAVAGLVTVSFYASLLVALRTLRGTGGSAGNGRP